MSKIEEVARAPDPAWLAEKRRKRFDKIDAMSPEMRECVNDYGYHVVNTLKERGITSPRQIRHVVEAILDEFSPTRGSFSKQGRRTEVFDAALSEEGE